MAASRLAPSVGLKRKGNAVTAATIPDERARRDPGGACVADERHDLDNAGFAERVTALAAVFAAAGLRPGGVLAIMLPNRVELVTSMFAAWRLGAAVTPVNPALTAQEARYQIDDAGATLVVADEAAAAMLRDGPYRIIGLTEVTAPPPPPAPPRPGDRSGRAGPADLHQRDDGPAQGGQAGPRQHQRDRGDHRQVVRDDG